MATLEMWEPWVVTAGTTAAPEPAPIESTGVLLVLDVIRRRKLVGVPGLRLDTGLDKQRVRSILDMLVRSERIRACGDPPHVRYRLAS
jgi:hypothetical protein